MHENNRLQRKKRVQKLNCKKKVKREKVNQKLKLKKVKNNGKLVNPVSLRCLIIVIEIIHELLKICVIFLY